MNTFIHPPETVIDQLPVSRSIWETEQKSGHTEIFIAFARLKTFESVYIWFTISNNCALWASDALGFVFLAGKSLIHSAVVLAS